MQCPHCQLDNPPTMKFCVECGARLERRCPQCGAETQPAFKFCGQCGAPIAHEDVPRRAVHAALGIQCAVREYSQELQAQCGLTLQMRIGINTGPVVVGKIGDDLRMDYTAVGDTTNLAARLQQLARPASVVISEATHWLVAGFFETLDLDELAVKGHAPTRAFAAQSLEMATPTDSRKYVARAQRLQGDILAANGRLNDAARPLEASVRLAESLQTPREAWLGKFALGEILARLGREQEAAAHFIQATETIEGIAAQLTLPDLRHSFLGAEPVVDIYQTLGRRPPLTLP